MHYTEPPAVIHQDPSPHAAEHELASYLQPQPTAEQTEQAQQQERWKYTFTHPWFEAVRRDWQEVTQPLVGKPLRILEVGSFEGSSTTWILDHLMDHERSTMTAVDWFQGSPEHAGPAFRLDEIERHFCNNVAKAKNHEKLRVLKGSSADRLVQLRAEKAQFDFIYIDGSHVAIDVLEDMALSWPMLAEGGTFVLDDFRWGLDGPEYDRPYIAIETFLRCAAPNIRWFERNGQIWGTKVAKQ